MTLVIGNEGVVLFPKTEIRGLRLHDERVAEEKREIERRREQKRLEEARRKERRAARERNSGDAEIFMIKSSRGDEEYRVVRRGDLWECDWDKCRGFKYSKSNPRSCRHVREAQAQKRLHDMSALQTAARRS